MVALTHDEAIDGLSQTGQVHDSAEFAIGVDADSRASLVLEDRFDGAVLHFLQLLGRELSGEELAPRLEELRWAKQTANLICSHDLHPSLLVTGL